MDDSSTTSQQQQNDDIEQNFLTQFSCMGTTDKDDLIKQFQSIGECLNYSTATFFLEMNNWNLQAAVGCYFDVMANSRLPSMQFLKDLTTGKDEYVTPNTPFTLSWLVQNNGDINWPDGTYLTVTQAPPNTVDENMKYYVPSLQPNDTTIITVNLVSPSQLGPFPTKWRLCHPYGSYFGSTIWSAIEVSASGTLALTQQLSQLQTSPIPDTNDVEFLETTTSVVQNSTPSTTLEDTEMW